MADRFRVLLKSINPATGQVVGEPRVLYDPEPKQRALHASGAENVLYGGAAGGGKSHGLRWHLILICLRVKNARVLLLRRQFTDLEKTHLLDLPTEVPPEIARYDQQKHRLSFRATGSVLQFGHCDNEGDFSGYLSTEWDAIGIDEAGQFDPRWLVKLSSRCRTTKPGLTPQMVYATNPGGAAHVWLKQHFITQTVSNDEDPEYDPRKYLFIQALVADNPHLDERYVSRLRSLPSAEREAFLYGNWDAFAGQFFAEWKHALHTVEPFEVPEWHEREGGLDWGYDPNPGVAYWCSFDEHGRGWLYRELVYRQKTPAELAQMLYDRCTAEAERTRTLAWLAEEEVRLTAPPVADA
jgi:hypothetical protein